MIAAKKSLKHNLLDNMKSMKASKKEMRGQMKNKITDIHQFKPLLKHDWLIQQASY